MAPTFRPGKGAALLFANVNMAQILQDVTVDASAQALKTTVFGNNDETYIAGVRDGTVKYAGLFDGSALSTASTATTGALDDRFNSALAASTQPVVTYGPEGDTLGRRARMWRQETVEYTAMSPASDVVKVSAAGQMSGRQDSGVWLKALSATTSTGAFTAVDSAYDAGTTGGGVGHFHMTADSTITSFIVKIQHSTAASASTATWADLITFTDCDESTGAAAAQRSTVSGTIKRQTRAIVTTFTGGANNSATFAVAFARRGLQR